jgi:hypothetical protein
LAVVGGCWRLLAVVVVVVVETGGCPELNSRHGTILGNVLIVHLHRVILEMDSLIPRFASFPAVYREQFILTGGTQKKWEGEQNVKDQYCTYGAWNCLYDDPIRWIIIHS